MSSTLDPNIRPGMIRERRKHMARLTRMIAMADILKISDEDVAWMTGKDDVAAAARKWLKAGAKIVVVTRGGNGVEAFTARDRISRPAVKVKVADTVGAGDTFTAGLLTALQRAKLLDQDAAGHHLRRRSRCGAGLRGAGRGASPSRGRVATRPGPASLLDI